MMGRIRGIDGLALLSDQYEVCNLCPALCETRERPVFGGGSASADILIIGEAPSSSEEEENAVYVGDSGRLLMQLLADVWPADDRLKEIQGIEADEDLDDPNAPYFSALRDYLDDYIFWTNVVLCRTPENRTPTTQEIKNCKERLMRTIYAVDPMLIITTGKTAASVLVGKAVTISNKAGTVFDITVPSPVTGNSVRYPMLAIHHPAFLLRQGDQTLYTKKQGVTWETAEALRFGLGLLTAEYQNVYGTAFPERPPGVKK